MITKEKVFKFLKKDYYDSFPSKREIKIVIIVLFFCVFFWIYLKSELLFFISNYLKTPTFLIKSISTTIDLSLLIIFLYYLKKAIYYFSKHKAVLVFILVIIGIFVFQYNVQDSLFRTSEMTKIPLSNFDKYIIQKVNYTLQKEAWYCEDNTSVFSCSENDALYCDGKGNLIIDASKCGCVVGFKPYNDECILNITCSDGTSNYECSKEKPMFCINGSLKNKASKCDCPYDYRKEEEKCIKIMRCSDRTEYGFCSSQKPLYCDDGNLINKASTCGCPYDEVKDGENCVSKYMTDPKQTTLMYILDGKRHTFTFEVYRGLNDYLAGQEKSISYYQGERPPTTKDFVDKEMNNQKQSKELLKLVKEIKSITDNKDNRARIAISIVQHIPYDWEGFTSGDLNRRYPYEVLYDNKGVCGEKSELTAYLLRELGFSVVLFNYIHESHTAVGIKCPSAYDYDNTGYCFIETTRPTIITDSEGDYIGVGELSHNYEIVEISSGNSFDSVSQEYNDNLNYQKILAMGTIIPSNYYNQWLALSNKYDLQFNN